MSGRFRAFPAQARFRDRSWLQPPTCLSSQFPDAETPAFMPGEEASFSSCQRVDDYAQPRHTRPMKLTVKVKLLPSDEQRQRLKRTLETANIACNWISQQAWDTQTFGRVPLHKLTYYPVRERFKLSAQLAVRCIAK